MNFRIPLLPYLFLFHLTVFAQKGSPFPYLEGESLSNRYINIPTDTQGKYTLIGLAFSKKAEEYLNTWYQPIYNQFIYKPEKINVFAGSYDVHVYFIPMFTGAKRPAYEKVMENVKKDIDERLIPHVLFYKGTIKEYKDALHLEGKDVPYFFILNEEGTIVYTTSGYYSDTKMDQILSTLDEIWGEN